MKYSYHYSAPSVSNTEKKDYNMFDLGGMMGQKEPKQIVPQNQGFNQGFNQPPQNQGFGQGFNQPPQNQGFNQQQNQGFNPFNLPPQNQNTNQGFNNNFYK